MRVLEGKEAAREVARLAERGPASLERVEPVVREIVGRVRTEGEPALREYAERWDGLAPGQPLLVSKQEMQAALGSISSELRESLEFAAGNIRTFAEWQKPPSWMREIMPGVRAGQRVQPISDVGCYVPGGRFPLPSTLLMTVVPAQVAGVQRIVVVSPKPAKETLAAAALLGIEEFYRIGGAQAIAALAYGAVFGPVTKIVGPGNAYVTAAKKLVALDCAIDMLAGPTEALVVSDSGNAEFIAADLVSQAEHDPDTLCVFITSKRALAQRVSAAAVRRAAGNSNAESSLRERGVCLVAPHAHTEAVAWASAIASEHTTVDSALDYEWGLCAGSVFVGDDSAQAFGDYVTGPNHTLPTSGAARYRGGLSVLDFLKIVTVQEVTQEGVRLLAPHAIRLAEAEGLKAHADSLRVRLAKQGNAAC